jgi:hypothetical protein
MDEGGWWWLSFAGKEGFRGGCLVEAPDMGSAVIQASVLGINPRGEVRGLGPIPMPEGGFPLPVNRLLQKADIPDAMSWPNGDQE